MKRIGIFLVCMMLTTSFIVIFPVKTSGEKFNSYKTSIIGYGRNDFNESRIAFIFGKITNLSTIGDFVIFEAVKTRVITINPFSFNTYLSNEKFIVSKEYKGLIGVKYIFALCKINPEGLLYFTDLTNDVLDATTGKMVSRPNIDIYIISALKEGKVVELKLQLVTSGIIQNKLTTYYEMDLTTASNSYMAFYGGGEIGITDQNDTEVDIISYSGIGTNELSISFNLSSDDEKLTDLSSATFEFSLESEEGYYDEYPNNMQIIEVTIDCPATGTIGVPIQFYGNTSYEGTDLVWSWDFGDNETSDLRNPIHTYNEPGTYEVSLEVFDSIGYVYGFNSTTITINGIEKNHKVSLDLPI